MRTLLASAWIPCLVGKLTRHALLEGATNARHRRGRHCQGVKHHGSDARAFPALYLDNKRLDLHGPVTGCTCQHPDKRLS